MADRITVTLHELVATMDEYADAHLRRHHGVSYNLFEFLAALVERAPLDISQLARCLRVTKAAVSKRVPGLVADGWVRATPAGGRRVELAPTATAMALVQAAGGELDAEFAAVFAETPPMDSASTVSIAALNARLGDLTRVLEQKERP
jgi:DNA-binding MarR family transcriptional regulator